MKPESQRIFTHINGLIRGKITRQAVKYLNQEKIQIPNTVSVNTPIEEFYWFGAPKLARKVMDYIDHNIYKFLWKNKL